MAIVDDFQSLLLQVWCSLSDPAIKKELARDLLFRRFRNKIESQKSNVVSLYSQLLKNANQQLQNQGLSIAQGEVSIIDASVIEVEQCRTNKDKDGKSTHSPEAEYNVNNGSGGKRKTTYGFKAHINADEDRFIKNAVITADNVHNSSIFECLLAGVELEVCAGSTYKSKKHDYVLKEEHFNSQILERIYRNKPLTNEQKKRNQRRSATRSVVERTFGVLKLDYGMKKARYLSIARNSAQFFMMSMAHNLKRGLSLKMA
jgi:transposase, IS5 family